MSDLAAWYSSLPRAGVAGSLAVVAGLCLTATAKTDRAALWQTGSLVAMMLAFEASSTTQTAVILIAAVLLPCLAALTISTFAVGDGRRHWNTGIVVSSFAVVLVGALMPIVLPVFLLASAVNRYRYEPTEAPHHVAFEIARQFSEHPSTLAETDALTLLTGLAAIQAAPRGSVESLQVSRAFREYARGPGRPVLGAIDI